MNPTLEKRYQHARDRERLKADQAQRELEDQQRLQKLAEKQELTELRARRLVEIKQETIRLNQLLEEATVSTSDWSKISIPLYVTAAATVKLAAAWRVSDWRLMIEPHFCSNGHATKWASYGLWEPGTVEDWNAAHVDENWKVVWYTTETSRHYRLVYAPVSRKQKAWERLRALFQTESKS